MASLTIRNLPDAVHGVLRVRAATNKRSLEAEIREILSAAAFPVERGPFGDELRANWSGVHGEDFIDLRNKAPHEPLDFG